jgi:hypothetical protein
MEILLQQLSMLTELNMTLNTTQEVSLTILGDKAISNDFKFGNRIKILILN